MKLEKLSVSFFSFMYLSYDFAWEVIEYVQGPRNFNIIILWMQDQSENHVQYVETNTKEVDIMSNNLQYHTSLVTK